MRQPVVEGMAEDGTHRPLGTAARLLPPLFMAVGALFATAAPSATGASRLALFGFAAVCGLVGAATWRMDWGRLPDPVIGLLPYMGGAGVSAVGFAAPTATGLAAVLLALVVMYCGVALSRARFLTALALGSLALTGAALSQDPNAAQVWQLIGTLIATASIGSALHWLRGLMDADTQAALAAQAEASWHQLAGSAQSVSVRQFAGTIDEVAKQARTMACGIETLEQLARGN